MIQILDDNGHICEEWLDISANVTIYYNSLDPKPDFTQWRKQFWADLGVSFTYDGSGLGATAIQFHTPEDELAFRLRWE